MHFAGGQPLPSGVPPSIKERDSSTALSATGRPLRQSIPTPCKSEHSSARNHRNPADPPASGRVLLKELLTELFRWRESVDERTAD